MSGDNSAERRPGPFSDDHGQAQDFSSRQGPTQGFAYRPEIDGLRSVAVLAVIIYHADSRLLSGGFIGVDVFFVISGFLITSLLLADLKSGRFSLAQFYERRCRRILPPLVVMALIVTILGWFFLLPADYRDFGSSLKGMAAFVANHYFFGKTGYFDTAAFTKPLLHTWSLSVEEQFYILLPVLLWFLYRRRPSAIPRVLGGLFLLSLAASCLMTYYWPAAAFYLLPARFWELMTGSLLALWPAAARPKGLAADLMSWFGLAVIAASAIFFNYHTLFPGPGALAPCLGAALFILGNSPGSRQKASLLSRPGPVLAGKISYSLYLWHWPLLVIPRYVHDAPLTPPMTLAALTATATLGYLSWRWVENPIRYRKILPGRRVIFIASGLSLLTLIIIGHAIRQSEGYIHRLPQPARQYALGVTDRYSSPPWKIYPRQVERRGVEYEFSAWDINPDQAPSFMVMGNSHARMWLAAVDMLARDHNVGGLVINPTSYRNCSFIFPDDQSPAWQWNCQDLLISFLDEAQARGVTEVLLALRYAEGLSDPPKPESPVEAGVGSERIIKGLEGTLKAARERGLNLWFMENVPEYETSVPHSLTWGALKGSGPESLAYDRQYFENRLAPLSRRLPQLKAEGLKYLPVGDIICPERLCLAGDAQGSFYMDDNHLSRHGARTFRQVLRPFFESRSDNKVDDSPAGVGQ